MMNTEQIVQITAMARGSEAWVVALSNYGRLWLYTPTTPPSGHGTWMPIDLPPGFELQVVKLFEQVDALGRMPKGYELYKRNDTGLFYWEQEAQAGQPPVQSELFERMEGAIASARNHYMVKHPPKPTPKPEPHRV